MGGWVWVWVGVGVGGCVCTEPVPHPHKLWFAKSQVMNPLPPCLIDAVFRFASKDGQVPHRPHNTTQRQRKNGSQLFICVL